MFIINPNSISSSYFLWFNSNRNFLLSIFSSIWFKRLQAPKFYFKKWLVPYHVLNWGWGGDIITKFLYKVVKKEQWKRKHRAMSWSYPSLAIIYFVQSLHLVLDVWLLTFICLCLQNSAAAALPHNPFHYGTITWFWVKKFYIYCGISFSIRNVTCLFNFANIFIRTVIY